MARSNRAAALKHVNTIINGLKSLQDELLERLSIPQDINDALEIAHRLDKVNLELVVNYGVRRHLKAAVSVSPPSQKMIASVNDLLQQLAEFEWQSARFSSVIKTARTLTRAFGKSSQAANKMS